MKDNYILKHKWEDIVGRKGSPLRLYFNYIGFKKWFENEFETKLNETNISFCRFEDGLVTTDNFLNISEKTVILEKIRERINDNIDDAMADIADFQARSDRLLAVSQAIGLNANKEDLISRFRFFENSWLDFSPAYVGLIYYGKVAEKLIINNYDDKDVAYKKLIEYVTADFESDFFNIKRIKSSSENYFKDSDKYLLALMKKIIKVRDFRKNACDLSWDQYLADFFDELGKKTCLYQHLAWVFPKEIERRLLGEKTNKKYPKECLIFFKSGKIMIEYSDDFATLRGKVLNLDATNLLHGQSAFGGIARGRVKILLPNDRKEIESNQILVTKMTTPDFVSVMKKAVAIITDEGGVTCHAAVIARELQVPCIIGTKAATKLLKDGDLVEVDANKGIVRRIND